ncbi:hypothetical protein QJS04_geneDACA016914 [Acorus gramineus]|uniref:Wall-associated receptor kinase domain-containing protein n=1 Tax=Acorus gramineus TaxID=55184 RepID=A0AAV9BQH3_ACOGR|nr:hypothetical protein QJS04_geneDACA016914 [Acorus gramineus]
MGATSSVKEDCYNEQGQLVLSNGASSFNLSNRNPYTFSDSWNKFTVLGCDTYSYMFGFIGDMTYAYMDALNSVFGCTTVCNNSDMVTNVSCNGIGCCQMSIPKGIKSFGIGLNSYNSHSRVIHFNPCGYAFLADQKWFTFHGLSDLSGFIRRNNRGVPLVLDWVISNRRCEETRTTLDYACVSQNSFCYEPTNGAPTVSHAQGLSALSYVEQSEGIKIVVEWVFANTPF